MTSGTKIFFYKKWKAAQDKDLYFTTQWFQKSNRLLQDRYPGKCRSLRSRKNSGLDISPYACSLIWKAFLQGLQGNRATSSCSVGITLTKPAGTKINCIYQSLV